MNWSIVLDSWLPTDRLEAAGLLGRVRDPCRGCAHLAVATVLPEWLPQLGPARVLPRRSLLKDGSNSQD